MTQLRPGKSWLSGASIILILLALGFVVMPAAGLLTGKARGVMVLFCVASILIGSGLGATAVYLAKGRRWAWSTARVIAIVWLAMWAIFDVGLVLHGGGARATLQTLQTHVFYYVVGGVLLWALVNGRPAIADQTTVGKGRSLRPD